MNKLANLIFFVLGFSSLATNSSSAYDCYDYDCEGLVFEYKGVSSEKVVSENDFDRPATNEGLAWMKKRPKRSKKVTIKRSKTKKRYACYGSLKSSADAFTNGYSGGRGCSSGRVYVRSHRRVCRSGKVTRVRGHYRRR